MRKRDDPQIYPKATCCVGARCGRPWEVWCRGCNLVYCAAHFDRSLHECPSRDKRSQAIGGLHPKGLALERGGISCAPVHRNGTAASSADKTVHRNGQNGKGKQ